MVGGSQCGEDGVVWWVVVSVMNDSGNVISKDALFECVWVFGLPNKSCLHMTHTCSNVPGSPSSFALASSSGFSTQGEAWYSLFAHVRNIPVF